MQRSGTTARIELDTPGRVRILLGAMAAGLVLFSAVTVFLHRTGFGGDDSQVSLFRIVLAGLGVALWIAAGVVRRVFAARPAEARGGARQLVLAIVQAAFAEAFGLMGAVFALLTGDLLFLVAPAVAVAALLLLMPRPASSGPPSIGGGPSSGSHPIEP